MSLVNAKKAELPKIAPSGSSAFLVRPHGKKLQEKKLSGAKNYQGQAKSAHVDPPYNLRAGVPEKRDPGGLVDDFFLAWFADCQDLSLDI